MNHVDSRDLQLTCRNFLSYFQTNLKTIEPVNSWKIIGTSTSAEILPKNQLNAEYNLRLNLN